MLNKLVLHLELEVDEDPPEIFFFFFNAMIQLFNMSLVQEPKYLFLQLSTAFAGDNLDQFYFPVNRFLQNTVKLRVDLIAAIVDVVQVEFKFCHCLLVSWAESKNQTAAAGSA